MAASAKWRKIMALISAALSSHGVKWRNQRQRKAISVICRGSAYGGNQASNSMAKAK